MTRQFGLLAVAALLLSAGYLFTVSALVGRMLSRIRAPFTARDRHRTTRNNTDRNGSCHASARTLAPRTTELTSVETGVVRDARQKSVSLRGLPYRQCFGFSGLCVSVFFCGVDLFWHAPLITYPAAWLALEARAVEAQALGVFTSSQDVGTPSTIGPGSAAYDGERQVYTISGGGENMWGTADHFHYVWRKVSGDVMLEADVQFVGTRPAGGVPDAHRKACLVIRQTLDPDSVYADAATHGDGLTSLQFRNAKGGITREVKSTMVGPRRLRVEKRGTSVSMSVAAAGEEFGPAGEAAKIELTGDFYVGLAVSAHNTGRIETAAFSKVRLTAF
jgi:hypothetical protein